MFGWSAYRDNAIKLVVYRNDGKELKSGAAGN